MEARHRGALGVVAWSVDRTEPPDAAHLRVHLGEQPSERPLAVAGADRPLWPGRLATDVDDVGRDRISIVADVQNAARRHALALHGERYENIELVCAGSFDRQVHTAEVLPNADAVMPRFVCVSTLWREREERAR